MPVYWKDVYGMYLKQILFFQFFLQKVFPILTWKSLLVFFHSGRVFVVCVQLTGRNFEAENEEKNSKITFFVEAIFAKKTF